MAVRDWFTFTGYYVVKSGRSRDACLAALRQNQGKDTLGNWGFGGHAIRLVLPRDFASQKQMHFGLEYYRLRYNSGRPTHVVQVMKGVLYEENGQTHVAAKVYFTRAGMMVVWIAVGIVAMSFALLLYNGNPVLWALVAMTGAFLLAVIAILRLDRYWIKRYVRRCMGI